MTVTNLELVEDFISLRNRMTEKMERSLIIRLPYTLISKLLHPHWFGLQILDKGRVIVEGTMYTRGNYYERFEEGIKPFVKLVFKVEKESVEKAVARADEIVASPLIKSNILVKGGGIGLNRNRD